MTLRARAVLLLAAAVLLTLPAAAHRLSPAYFGFTETAPNTFDVQWKVSISGGLAAVLEPQVPLGCSLRDNVRTYVIDDVRTRGDAALRHYTRAFDHANTAELRVDESQIDAAVERVGERVMAALETAAQRIRAFHEHARRTSWLDHTPSGGALGQLIRPLDRVGIYAPGGRSPYPSSVLMAAVPARVAEVSEVVLASPPGGPNGEVSDVLLAAARVAKVDSVYRVGGAQAIAALAYGTESLPRVDISYSYGGADGTVVEAFVAAGQGEGDRQDGLERKFCDHQWQMDRFRNAREAAELQPARAGPARS